MRLKMNFKPLHDRIAIKPHTEEEKTSGGIIIPDTAKEKPMRGEVVAVGSGVRDQSGKLVPLEVKVGDVVMYGKWGGSEIKVEGKDLVIMKESDVIGIITK
jgi:chaperonin GroES